MFNEAIAENYRVVTTRYGQGDEEQTIPLGSYRKGQGMEGRKGHVYVGGNRWAGIWLKGTHSLRLLENLQTAFSDLTIMQVGEGETTARIPFSDLDAILPMLGAKRRFKASNARLATLEKARAASPIGKPSRNERVRKAENALGSTNDAKPKLGAKP